MDKLLTPERLLHIKELVVMERITNTNPETIAQLQAVTLNKCLHEVIVAYEHQTEILKVTELRARSAEAIAGMG